MLSLTFNHDGLAVIRRDHGRSADLVTLSESYSALIAAEAVDAQVWLSVVLRCAELVPAALIEARCAIAVTVH